MVNFVHAVLCLFVLQIYVGAAPSNTTTAEKPISKLEEPSEIAKNEEPTEVDLKAPTEVDQDAPTEVNPEQPTEFDPEEPKLGSQPLLIEESKLNDNSAQSPRQKRFYNLYGYGVPPMNPIVYPGYNKRDQSAETGVYGYVEDPLEQIQRRLHDISSFVRQPVPAPTPTAHFPFFFPVIYIPQYGCECYSNNDNTPSPQPENPQSPGPENNQTNPDTDKRIGAGSNDGSTSNDTDAEYDEDEFSRPISFEPIQPKQPMMRPAPPVEHGSSEGESAALPTTTTIRPTRPRLPPTSQSRPVFPPGQSGQSTPYPSSFDNDIQNKNEQPSSCDGAVLSCCHQPYVTYDCFVSQGCPRLTSYGNPCDPQAILHVIEKFRKFYGVRNGQ